jgi:cytochrome c551/c552
MNTMPQPPKFIKVAAAFAGHSNATKEFVAQLQGKKMLPCSL